MRVRVHTKGIKGSGMIEEGEHADVMFASVLEIDGHVIDRTQKIEVTSGEDFTYVKVILIPGELDYISHTAETWKELLDKGEAQREAYMGVRNSEGRLIAKAKDE